MCGLLFTTLKSISKQNFNEALDLMAHRGPDANGYFEHARFKMGHKRLKILDLDDRGNQPFFSRDGRYLCIYNGEIYNYLEVAKKYHITLKTTCDTELLVELFGVCGPSMLGELNGMFAFIIYDLLEHKYFVARDRLGIKPLYIHEGPSGVIISSEINAILRLLPTIEIDDIGERQYLKLRSFFSGRTLYRGVKMFPQAHYGLFYEDGRSSNGRLTRYWDVDFSCERDIQDDEVEDVLTSAIAYRNMADVPVGSYLSGGLDSTIITGVAKQRDSWTVGFAEENEFSYARLAANAFGSDHHEILVDKNMFLEALDEILKRRMEPLSVPNEVLLYLMTVQVKSKNTVVLSGEGADELFHGYDRIFRWASESTWSVEEFDAHYSYGSHDDNEIIEDVLAPYQKYDSALQKTAAFFQIEHLSGLLRRLDNSTMMASVEGRVPFVDHRFVEMMAKASFKYRSGDGKIVKAPLKRIFKKLLPVEIVERQKVGFPVPLERIFPSNQGQPMDTWLSYNLNFIRETVV